MLDISHLSQKVHDRWRLLTLSLGSVFVTLWTVIRSWNNGVNFDVIGQIGVAQQWAHGLHTGAQFGATNYLLKLPLYFLVNMFSDLSPHVRLLVLALVCNIGTFVLLVVLMECILGHAGLKPNTWFYLGLLWLASISGRVYWLDYANSRNLETVAGLVILYLGLRFLEVASLQRAAWLAFGGGLVFFADQLQLYTIGGGLVLYAVASSLQRPKVSIKRNVMLVGAIIVAVVLSKLLLTTATHILPLSFLIAPTGDHSSLLSAHGIARSLHGVADSTFRIFDSSFYEGSSSINRLRQVLNLAVLVGVISSLVYGWRRQAKAHQLLAVVAGCIVASYVSYVASGQALQPVTERYLLMLPLLVTLSLGAVSPSFPRKTWFTNAQRAWLVALAVSGLLTIGALVHVWPQRYEKDQRITSMLQFLEQNRYRYAASSRDGIVETYFSNGHTIVAPFICQPDHRLVASNLFYDTAGFERLRQTTLVPLIIPSGGIVSSGSVCNQTDIIAQFGPPTAWQPIDSGSSALLYPPAQLLR